MRVHPSKVSINNHLCKVKPDKQFKKLYCYPVSQACIMLIIFYGRCLSNEVHLEFLLEKVCKGKAALAIHFISYTLQTRRST